MPYLEIAENPKNGARASKKSKKNRKKGQIGMISGPEKFFVKFDTLR